ncbi:MAG: LytTR family DNA-binding domain-containing protein [Prevotella sp.]|jgi:hypothetical protein
MNTKNLFLFRSYPSDADLPLSTVTKDCLLWQAIVFLILVLFRPFGLNLFRGNIWLLAFEYSVVSFVCSFVYHFCIYCPWAHHVKRWTVGHSVLSIFFLILFIAVGCSVLSIFVFHVDWSLPLFLSFCVWCGSIGIFISFVAVLIDYNRRLRTRMESLLTKNTEEQTDVFVTFHNTAVRGANLTIPINDFLYAEVQKNDVTVHYMKDGAPTTAVIRSTLANVKADLDYENILQCHRSFLVNVNNITSARGNSNGYQLKLGPCTDVVPVSRSYVPALKAFLA